MGSIKVDGRTCYYSRFRSMATAWESARSARKFSLVIQGSDGFFWVARSGDAEAMHRAGFEYAA